MLDKLCCILIHACILLTTAALPVAVVNKKDSKFCCKCTLEEDESTGESVTNSESGLINPVNIPIYSSAGCKGSTATIISGTGLVVPSIQIHGPQVQFLPGPVNIMLPQQYLLYNVQPLQSSFFNMQQPKFTTQCCIPCSSGNGLCCCTPGATTVGTHDSHTFHSSYYPAGAEISLRRTSLLISTIIPLILDYLF